MIEISTNYSFLEEKKYIFDVIFDEILGISYTIKFVESLDLFIVKSLNNNNEFKLPDLFFSKLDSSNYFSKNILPESCLVLELDSRFEGLLYETNSIPIIYGEDINSTLHDFCIDIFGSSFFMISRFEEMISSKKDFHSRFSAKDSISYSSNFLNRPIVDEYIEILWKLLKLNDDKLIRKKETYNLIVSCDVDIPYEEYNRSIFKFFRKVGGDIFKRKSLLTLLNTLCNFIFTKFNLFVFDKLYRFNWMMDVADEYNNKIDFFFIADHSESGKDGFYSLGEKRIQKLFNLISKNGHKIGLHGSYNSFNNYNQLLKETEILNYTLKKLNIIQNNLGIRQHYLRWDYTTPFIQNACNISIDNTLGFADHFGFRCGTCKEFSMFDLDKRRRLQIKQRPLIVMESTFIENVYMALGINIHSWNLVKDLANKCKFYKGNFSLLWHNSSLINSEQKTFFKNCIKEFSINENCSSL